MTERSELPRLVAALADRYTIERELGAGGMAIVYLAEDVKHHRRVALKVLRPGRSDLYALGCVLYEMLAGEPPYTGPTPLAIIAKRLMEPVPRISVVRETVPPRLEQVLTRVLAKAPADRFRTADAFIQGLQGLVRPARLPRRGRAPLRAGCCRQRYRR